jgi:hypothetical protein
MNTNYNDGRERIFDLPYLSLFSRTIDGKGDLKDEYLPKPVDVFVLSRLKRLM